MTSISNAWVVVAAFNEAEVLTPVLIDVLKIIPNVILVDDGSTDHTDAIGNKFPVHYLRHRVNMGQGAAIQTGLSYALQKGAETIVTFDADGQMDASDIPAVCAPLNGGTFEVVLGTRFSPEKKNQIPFLRKVLLKIAVWFTRVNTGLNLTDTHNGFRALRRSAAEKIYLKQNKMAHASEFLQQLAELKLRFVEVPVSIQYSEYSKKKGQKTANAFNILWELFFR